MICESPYGRTTLISLNYSEIFPIQQSPFFKMGITYWVGNRFGVHGNPFLCLGHLVSGDRAATPEGQGLSALT